MLAHFGTLIKNNTCGCTTLHRVALWGGVALWGVALRGGVALWGVALLWSNPCIWANKMRVLYKLDHVCIYTYLHTYI